MRRQRKRLRRPPSFPTHARARISPSPRPFEGDDVLRRGSHSLHGRNKPRGQHPTRTPKIFDKRDRTLHDPDGAMDVRRVLSNDECNNAIAHRPHLSNSPSITIPRSAAKSCHNSTGWIKEASRGKLVRFSTTYKRVQDEDDAKKGICSASGRRTVRRWKAEEHGPWRRVGRWLRPASYGMSRTTGPLQPPGMAPDRAYLKAKLTTGPRRLTSLPQPDPEPLPRLEGRRRPSPPPLGRMMGDDRAHPLPR